MGTIPGFVTMLQHSDFYLHSVQLLFIHLKAELVSVFHRSLSLALGGMRSNGN